MKRLIMIIDYDDEMREPNGFRYSEDTFTITLNDAMELLGEKLGATPYFIMGTAEQSGFVEFDWEYIFPEILKRN